MIEARDLIAKFRYAIDNHWGYIWGTAGVLWTAARQRNSTREMTVKYGAKWIGHHVADCSGLFSWAFRQLGGSIYHGSNTIYRSYCSAKGKLRGGSKENGEGLRPGTAVFTGTADNHGHIGLYIGDGRVIEAKGTQAGVIESKVTDKKWTWWGELKDVHCDGQPEPAPVPPEPTHPTLRQGAKGAAVKEMQEKLLKAGEQLPRYGADGKFGNETLAAVKSFQRTHGLEADGICGPKTWAELDRA